MVDTGPLVAAALVDDPDHERCARWFAATPATLVVPDLVIAEVCYLLASGARANVETAFLDSLIGSRLRVEHITDADIQRAAALVRTYADFPLGVVDAAVVAIAERLRVTEVATLDRRHFSTVRPTHVSAFELVP